MTEMIDAKSEPGRSRCWTAEQIARQFRSKLRAAEDKGAPWCAQLLVEGEDCPVEGLKDAPDDADIVIRFGMVGKAPAYVEHYRLARSEAKKEDKLVELADVNVRVINPLISALERITALHVKSVEAETKREKTHFKQGKQLLKMHKKLRKAQAALVDEKQAASSGLDAILKSVGEQMGQEGFQKFADDLSGKVFNFLTEVVKQRIEPAAPAKPASPRRKR